jgi:hypothetical protein
MNSIATGAVSGAIDGRGIDGIDRLAHVSELKPLLLIDGRARKL